MAVISCYCGKCDKNICFGRTKLKKYTPSFPKQGFNRDKSPKLANKDKIIFKVHK